MPARTVDRLVKQLSEWLAASSNRERLREFPRRDLARYVADNSESPAARLLNHSWWDGCEGTRLVLEGDESGWLLVQRSFWYTVWSARILLAKLDMRKAEKLAAHSIVFPLVHALGNREDSFALWLGSRLVEALERRDKRIYGWHSAPFWVMAPALFDLWQGTGAGGVLSKFSLRPPYAALIENWTRPERFLDALIVACRYHVEQAFDDNADEPRDFFQPLYNIFPIEMLAIKRIRQEQGLPMPEIDHPLMQTPLANPPEVMPKVEDPLLDAVIAKARKELPIGDPW
jgi:hypothetical protein